MFLRNIIQYGITADLSDEFDRFRKKIYDQFANYLRLLLLF